MFAHKIMYHPIDIQRSLKAPIAFRISVGFSAKGRAATAEGAVEALTMVGMNVIFLDILYRIRVFGAWRLVFRAFRASFARLRPLVLYPDLNIFAQGLTGAASFAIPKRRGEKK
jgi:hypothetical protein